MASRFGRKVQFFFRVLVSVVSCFDFSASERNLESLLLSISLFRTVSGLQSGFFFPQAGPLSVWLEVRGGKYQARGERFFEL